MHALWFASSPSFKGYTTGFQNLSQASAFWFPSHFIQLNLYLWEEALVQRDFTWLLRVMSEIAPSEGGGLAGTLSYDGVWTPDPRSLQGKLGILVPETVILEKGKPKRLGVNKTHKNMSDKFLYHFPWIYMIYNLNVWATFSPHAVVHYSCNFMNAGATFSTLPVASAFYGWRRMEVKVLRNNSLVPEVNAEKHTSAMCEQSRDSCFCKLSPMPCVLKVHPKVKTPLMEEVVTMKPNRWLQRVLWEFGSRTSAELLRVLREFVRKAAAQHSERHERRSSCSLDGNRLCQLC